MSGRLPASIIWALGATQIIGYGTLYYSFSVLAPHVGASFGWSPEAVFGSLTVALLAGGVASPAAGHLVDRIGASRAMTMGSIVAALMLAAAACAPNGPVFAAILIAIEVASTLVLYAAAFAAIVQLGGSDGQRSITHLTLIAGFASTVFWPLTSVLLGWMDWRSVYLVFAAANLLICAPLHWRLGRAEDNALPSKSTPQPGRSARVQPPTLAPNLRTLGFALMLAGFALEGLVLSAILMQVAPLLTSLQLGEGALLVTSLFGPAQVLSRLTNMILGRDLPSTYLAIIAATLLPLGTVTLLLSAPSVPGGVLFAVLFGLGSGLTSIVAGALPLHLLGSDRFGTRLGWLSSARQVASAIAPFLMALAMGAIGITMSLWLVVLAGALGVAVFVLLSLLQNPVGLTSQPRSQTP